MAVVPWSGTEAGPKTVMALWLHPLDPRLKPRSSPSHGSGFPGNSGGTASSRAMTSDRLKPEVWAGGACHFKAKSS
jgi:hypothetical protein